MEPEANDKARQDHLRRTAFDGLIYCGDYKCSHSVAIGADRWAMMSGCPTSTSFVCSACGKRGADVRPDFGRKT